MARILNSFKIRSDGKILDYRSGEKLNLSRIKSFFQSSYSVKKIWHGSRHVLGILTKDSVDYFLKLSTNEGISVVTKNEFNWNNYFNKYFPKNFHYSVPKNLDSGLYKEKYFYLVTDYFNGKLLCTTSDTYEKADQLIRYIPQVIKLSELIQTMPFVDFTDDKGSEDYKAKFVNKAHRWFSDVPLNVQKKFKVKNLLDIVKGGVDKLISKPRHGDFTPWHIIKLKKSGLGLIDGEHALPDSVENYDICYFIQRVFSILKNPALAKVIYTKLVNKRYDIKKLQTVLAARAIGGFLDESLKDKPDYHFAVRFTDWVESLYV